MINLQERSREKYKVAVIIIFLAGALCLTLYAGGYSQAD